MKLTNEELMPMGAFLGKLELPAQVSRARTKLTTKIREIVQELSESERALVSDLGGVVDEAGSITWPGNNVPVEYHNEHMKLMKEVVDIELGQPTLIDVMRDFFAKWDAPLKDGDAIMFDILYDSLDIDNYLEHKGEDK